MTVRYKKTGEPLPSQRKPIEEISSINIEDDTLKVKTVKY